MNQFDITKALAAEQHHDRTRAASESSLSIARRREADARSPGGLG